MSVRNTVFGLISAAIAIVFFVACAEVVLRFMPVSTGLRAQSVDAEHPVLHFEPNRSFTYSSGWNFAIVNKGRINNDGFINDQDYDPKAKTPLLAVVGDSYIEAEMTPYAQTVHGRLAAASGSDHRVYSFGASGAQLSTYLIWARYARDTYHPQSLVVNVVGNDFDESIPQYKNAPELHYFLPNGPGGQLNPGLIGSYQAGSHRIASASALLRYMYFDLNMVNLPQRLAALFKPAAAPANYVGNTDASVTQERMEDSQLAVDTFLNMLPSYSGLDPSHILLVIDGVRPELYEPEKMQAAGQSYFVQMRDYFIAKAHAKGFEVVDMHPLFVADFQKNGEKFEFATDNHWNGNGHRVAFEGVSQSRVFKNFMSSVCDCQNAK